MRVRDTYSAIIVGGGAAADYVATSELFTKRGIKLLGCFSEKDAKAEVDERSALERFCAEKAVDIFILTCSGEAAAHCLAVAESLGIQGVLNLSSLDLSSDKLIVRNIHIEDALMMLCSEL